MKWQAAQLSKRLEMVIHRHYPALEYTLIYPSTFPPTRPNPIPAERNQSCLSLQFTSPMRCLRFVRNWLPSQLLIHHGSVLRIDLRLSLLNGEPFLL